MRTGPHAALLSGLLSFGAAALACGPTVGAPAGAGGGTSTATHGDTTMVNSTSGSGSGLGSSSTTAAHDSSTGEPQFEGPGCGAPPPCDRGTFDGHARIESAADLAQFAGFTEVTGALEIMNASDLVCLDTLACLEVVGRDVRIQDNAALRSTDGLSGLGEVGQADNASGAIIVTHNAALERLAGFAVRDVPGSLLIVENPSLRAVPGFRELRSLEGLHVTANPNLELLDGLRGVEFARLCYVSFNESLCSDEVAEVCGGLEDIPRGTAVYNHPDCPALPEGDFPAPVEWEGCDLFADDCPIGQKCIVVENEVSGQREWACRPVVEDPAGSHQACSVLGDPWDGLDTCERNSMCWNDECVPVCRGTHNDFVCLSTEEQCTVNSDGTLVLCQNVCDPLAQNCADNEGCYAVDGAFFCRESFAGPGDGGSAASCEFFSACEPGLICVNADIRADCTDAGSSCCSEVCDITQPSCPAGLACIAVYEPFPAHIPRHLENVGLCADPV